MHSRQGRNFLLVCENEKGEACFSFVNYRAGPVMMMALTGGVQCAVLNSMVWWGGHSHMSAGGGPEGTTVPHIAIFQDNNISAMSNIHEVPFVWLSSKDDLQMHK